MLVKFDDIKKKKFLKKHIFNAQYIKRRSHYSLQKYIITILKGPF